MKPYSYSMQTKSMKSLHNLPLFLLLLIFISPAHSADPVAYTCDGNNQTGQIIENIEKLLPQLVDGTILNGFINTSYGDGSTRIYGLAQCRGDVPKPNCSACIHDAAQVVRDPNHCPTQSGARVWYDFCFLRYNTDNFFGQVDTSGWIFWNLNNVRNPNEFNKILNNLVDTIKSEAVGPNGKGLGTGSRKLTYTNSTLYGLVQCTRDLSRKDCTACLDRAIFPTECKDKEGCRVLFGSCYVRYEIHPIFFSPDSEGSLARGAVEAIGSRPWKVSKFG